MEVPCGHCTGCRLDKSRDWAIRAHLESTLFTHNSFITLTYDPLHIPRDGGLRLEHFQQFMRELRRANGNGVRFMHSGEYGEAGDRPHYHAIIFGKAFTLDEMIRKTPHGDLYRSEELSRLWRRGYSSVGSVTFRSCGYVARYVMKKAYGDKAQDERYGRLDPDTGEITRVRPEYSTMSRRPGIGFHWFQKYWRDVYPKDFINIDGKKYPPPAYFDYLLEKLNPDLHTQVMSNREVNARHDDHTDNMLRQKAEIIEQRSSQLKRNL